MGAGGVGNPDRVAEPCARRAGAEAEQRILRKAVGVGDPGEVVGAEPHGWASQQWHTAKRYGIVKDRGGASGGATSEGVY